MMEFILVTRKSYTLVKKSKIYNLNSVLVTFDPHPRSILNRNSNNISLIMNLNQKLKIIEDLGINFVYIIKFTKSFSKVTAKEFMSQNYYSKLST